MFSFRQAACVILKSTSLNVQKDLSNVRSIKRWVAPTLREINARRRKLGPQAPKPRSSFTDWNYSAELYAFATRLSENIEIPLLQQAFTNRSYTVREEQKQKDMGIAEPILEAPDNRPLIEAGQKLLNSYVKGFVEKSLPNDAPQSLINAVVDYLLSKDTIAKISRQLGTSDLILAADFPVEDQTLVDTFQAVVGAIGAGNKTRAELFIRDFVCTHLNQLNYADLWCVDDPMAALQQVCTDRKMAAPEPRLIGDCGKNTILAAFNVGIYCDRKMMGQGFGETVAVAINEACKDSLRTLYHIQPHQQMIKL